MITHVDNVERTSPEQVKYAIAAITIHGSSIVQVVRMLLLSMTIPADSVGRTSREQQTSVPAMTTDSEDSATAPTDHIIYWLLALQ